MKICQKQKSNGELEPKTAYCNQIPDAQLWGNSRFIWQTFIEDNVRQVWKAHLSEAEKATTTLIDYRDSRIEEPALAQAWAVVNQQYWSPIVRKGRC